MRSAAVLSLIAIILYAVSRTETRVPSGSSCMSPVGRLRSAGVTVTSSSQRTEPEATASARARMRYSLYEEPLGMGRSASLAYSVSVVPPSSRVTSADQVTPGCSRAASRSSHPCTAGVTTSGPRCRTRISPVESSVSDSVERVPEGPSRVTHDLWATGWYSVTVNGPRPRHCSSVAAKPCGCRARNTGTKCSDRSSSRGASGAVSSSAAQRVRLPSGVSSPSSAARARAEASEPGRSIIIAPRRPLPAVGVSPR